MITKKSSFPVKYFFSLLFLFYNITQMPSFIVTFNCYVWILVMWDLADVWMNKRRIWTTERNKQTFISCTRSTRVHLRMLQTANCLRSNKSQSGLALLDKHVKASVSNVIALIHINSNTFARTIRRRSELPKTYMCFEAFYLSLIPLFVSLAPQQWCRYLPLVLAHRHTSKTALGCIWDLCKSFAFIWVGDCVKCSHICDSYWPSFRA